MTLYQKPAIHPAWGESNTTSADMITPPDSDILIGWPLTATPPSRQRFNFLLNWLSAGMRYVAQRGLPEYNYLENYPLNACVIGTDGLSYKSLVNSNLNNSPSLSPAQWERWGFNLAQIRAAGLTSSSITIPCVPGAVFDARGLGRIVMFQMTISQTLAAPVFRMDVGQIIYVIFTQNGFTFTWPANVFAASVDITGSIQVYQLAVASDNNAYAVSAPSMGLQ